ncbi:hypothetical protein DERF_003987 [Dermatophagoides farinae]|uniref:Uncharacterized protein n=1 Tax=Dermatophagoides farinae TaxID=6954 RepID=A0A922IHG2_DERFA|nr:hypothetical protein DERF_003987 [Dermatophagoides farinae]
MNDDKFDDMVRDHAAMAARIIQRMARYNQHVYKYNVTYIAFLPSSESMFVDQLLPSRSIQ